MTTLVSVRGEPWRRRLYLPAYSVSEAARYAHTKPGTVSYWHYRGGRLGPALPGRERRRPLSYLELVEVAFLSVFRSFGVPLQRIRRAREYVAKTFSFDYPFARYRFMTEGYHVLLDLEEVEPNRKEASLIVTDAGGQLGWAEAMGHRFMEFDYEDGGEELAIRWHVAGRTSPVIIDPKISFGAPTVNGIPTWAVKGRYNAGESVIDIQDDFGLEEDEVAAGLAFEGVPLAA